MTNRFINTARGETGGIKPIVQDSFKKNFAAMLQDTPYGDNEYIETMREEFDEEVKWLFREDGDREVYIRIAGRFDKFEDENGAVRIESGLLAVPR